jgi:hypothetical protein
MPGSAAISVQNARGRRRPCSPPPNRVAGRDWSSWLPCTQARLPGGVAATACLSDSARAGGVPADGEGLHPERRVDAICWHQVPREPSRLLQVDLAEQQRTVTAGEAAPASVDVGGPGLVEIVTVLQPLPAWDGAWFPQRPRYRGPRRVAGQARMFDQFVCDVNAEAVPPRSSQNSTTRSKAAATCGLDQFRSGSGRCTCRYHCAVAGSKVHAGPPKALAQL